MNNGMSALDHLEEIHQRISDYANNMKGFVDDESVKEQMHHYAIDLYTFFETGLSDVNPLEMTRKYKLIHKRKQICSFVYAQVRSYMDEHGLMLSLWNNEKK